MNVAAPARIVVALDPEAQHELALEIARHLPQNAATELLGLFVEDARLLAHASSRLAREIVLSGGERALERPALERQMRAQAAEQRRRFESAAVRLGLPHAFHVARGERFAELVREAADAEALVVTLAAHAAALRGWSASALRQLARAPLRSVLFAREGWVTGNRIVALLTRPERSAPSLQAAIRFARASRSPLTVLLRGAGGERVAEIEQWLAQALGPTGLGAPLVLAAGDLTVGRLCGVSHDARLVVLPSAHSTSEEAFIDAALDTLRVPLLLVREEEGQ
jgi:hypothetical protein